VHNVDPSIENEIVERAIARVLEAERSALAAIDEARQDAAARSERARALTRAIAERTERRIGRVRERFEQDIAGEVAALDRTAVALELRYEVNSADSAQLVHAVERVAAELTGGSQ
jgi:hypothetical protein